MKRAHQIMMANLAFLPALSGCADRDVNQGTSGAANAPISTDKWLGQWNGPEGTFLKLEGGKGRYTVIIQNLDGPQTFQGNTDGSRIQFDRNGVRESLHPTNGVDTGMKWLVDKHDCLTVRPGEGYCRE